MEFDFFPQKEEYTNKTINTLKVKVPYLLHTVVFVNYDKETTYLTIINNKNQKTTYNLNNICPEFVKIKNQKTKTSKIMLVNSLSQNSKYNQYSFSIEIFE